MSYSRMLLMVSDPFWIDKPFDSSTKCFFRVFSVAQKSSDFSSVGGNIEINVNTDVIWFELSRHHRSLNFKLDIDILDSPEKIKSFRIRFALHMPPRYVNSDSRLTSELLNVLVTSMFS